MALSLITAGTQAVTLADAKAHLNVTHDLDDAIIGVYILAAQGHIEQVLGAPLTSETWEQSSDGFPCGPIRLLRAPVTAVASVKYDVNGVETTLDTDNYTVDLVSGRVWSVLAWPTADAVGSVRVRFTAGYAAVPAALRAAVLLTVGDLYANRESKVDGSQSDNPTVARLLWPYRPML